MAEVKISQLPPATGPAQGGDLLASVQGGVTVQQTIANTIPGGVYVPSFTFSGLSSLVPSSASASYSGNRATSGAVITVVVKCQIVASDDPVIFNINNPITANFTTIKQVWTIQGLIHRVSSPGISDAELLSISSVIGSGVQVSFTPASLDTFNVNFSYQYQVIS